MICAAGRTTRRRAIYLLTNTQKSGRLTSGSRSFMMRMVSRSAPWLVPTASQSPASNLASNIKPTTNTQTHEIRGSLRVGWEPLFIHCGQDGCDEYPRNRKNTTTEGSLSNRLEYGAACSPERQFPYLSVDSKETGFATGIALREKDAAVRKLHTSLNPGERIMLDVIRDTARESRSDFSRLCDGSECKVGRAPCQHSRGKDCTPRPCVSKRRKTRSCTTSCRTCSAASPRARSRPIYNKRRRQRHRRAAADARRSSNSSKQRCHCKHNSSTHNNN